MASRRPHRPTHDGSGAAAKAIDDDMLAFAIALKNKGVPVPGIAKKLTIKTGKKAGHHPSVASLYRALAEAEEATVIDGAQVIGPRCPIRARIIAPGRNDLRPEHRAPRSSTGGFWAYLGATPTGHTRATGAQRQTEHARMPTRVST
jgi:hypothetical protein